MRRRKGNPLPLTNEPVDGGDHAEARALSDERSQAVQRAIVALPEELRELIELRHFQGASYEEMAIALKLPQGTVMSRLYRARKLLRAALKRDPVTAPSGEKGGAA